ncbi:MarC family protein [Acidilobus sp.]|jgi:multiple antibiotic resistance protein|uniref:MarC family protein n=1 Tax=Acidilobus sp. TaxID=1872109 RepID=UPI003D0492F6
MSLGRELFGLGEAVVTLFIVLDPFSVVPFYVSTVEKLPLERRGGFLRTLIYSAIFMLLAFIIIGDYVLELLGVTLSDFRIAAGIILLVYAISSLFDIEIGAPSSPESIEKQAIVPLATPLLAGPGSISTALYFRYVYGYPVAIASVLINAALAYVILYFGERLMRLLGKHGALLIDKFMSLILAGFAVSLIRASI